ncbi:MAG: hypothetical protein C7B45_15060 [Sulfobacillus acidophilus]|uniref:Mandelate racemase/muconate lactonizing enzyme C-terminal domain-containing protein n=1 Tax=Sulfobacillus acidophilus TaxID=53633 RepID=A0A2T2WDU8_9FIRM|nr:MAG: hypothetical protein C7B45_15060 [Sulfobacillus acidophilus]
MRITHVSTAVVEANFDYTFVRVYTDTNVVGIGECFPGPGLTAVIKDLEEVIVGQDPMNVEKVWRRMYQSISGTSPIGGVGYNAISGIECALLDIAGKTLNVPVYQLLGGWYRSQIRIYADCHAGKGLESLTPTLLARTPRWMQQLEGEAGLVTAQDEVSEVYSPEAYARKARQAVDRGYTAIKFDLDVPTPTNPTIGVQTLEPYSRTITNADLDFLVSIVDAVSREVGRNIYTAYDLHWMYNLNDALRLAQALEPYGVGWLEDPVPPENVDGLAFITRQTKTPILSGENWHLRQGFRQAFEQRALNLIAPDFQRVGGLIEGKKVCDTAELYGIPVAPHCISSPIGLMASAHVCAAIPNFVALEFHGQDVPFWEDLAQGSELVIDGGYVTPKGPGLGIDLNERVAREYAKAGEPFFDE